MASAPRWRSTASRPGGLGIKNYGLTDKTGKVVGIKVVDGSEDLLIVTQSGILIRTHVDAIRMAGRATQGVIVMRFKEEGDRVISIALAERDNDAEVSQPETDMEPVETPELPDRRGAINHLEK